MRALSLASRRLSTATFLSRTVVPRTITITPTLSARPGIPRRQYATTATAASTHNTLGVSNLDWKISPMATARKVHLSPTTDTGVWSTGITEESAKTASEVLQEDLEKHHVYFNNMGFHSEFPSNILESGMELKTEYETRSHRSPHPYDLCARRFAR